MPAADENGGASDRRWLKPVAVVGTAMLVAVGSAVGTGLGGRILDFFGGEDPSLVSHSESEQVSECGTSLFVREPRASELAGDRTSTIPAWGDFQHETGAAVVSPDVVEVSIQGESNRSVTLTGIDFEVSRRARPQGAAFALPCGGPGQGRFVEVDLDRDPVTITASSKDRQAPVGGPVAAVQTPAQAIRFPWNVSISDPLLLYIVARTKRCDCTWRAEISWRSGGKSGVLSIDNGGRGYVVVGGAGAPTFVRDVKGWRGAS